MRRVLVAIFCTSVLVACSSPDSTSTDAASETATVDTAAPVGAATPYELFIDAVGDAEPTAQQALDWFVSLTGATVPGGEPSFGIVGGAVSFDGALDGVVDHWDEYSADQQAALIDLLRPIDAAAPATAEGALGSPMAGLRAPTIAVDPDLQALVAPVNEEVGRLLGTTIDAASIALRPINAQLVEGTAHALAEGPSFGWRAPGAGCTIVYGRAFSNSTLSHQRALLAHEIAHCHAFLNASAADNAALPKWYSEGSAAWVGEVIGGGSGVNVVRSFWKAFLDGNASLATGDRGYSFLRDTYGYSAIGVFQWAAERQGQATIGASIIANLGASTEAKLEFLFGTAGTPQREELLSSFATAPVRRPLGPSWQFRGIGLDSFGLGGVGRTMVDHPLTSGAALDLALSDGGRIGTAALTITPAADVDLVHIATTGYGRISWNGEGERFSVDGSIDQVYCVGEACRCAESLRDRADVIPVSEGAQAVVALAADDGVPMRVVAKGYHLADGSCDPCPAAGPSRAIHSSSGQPGSDSVAASDPICGPGTTVAPADASCLVGTWLVDNNAMASAFQAITSVPGAPPSTQSVSGTFAVEFRADGTMSVNVVDWTTAATEDGPVGTPPILFESVFNGSTSGTWTADAVTLSIVNAGTFGGRAFITIAGTRSEITGPQLPNLPVGNGASNYVCTPEGQLVIRARVAGAVDLTFNRSG